MILDYVLCDPTGNITVLVLTPVPIDRQADIAARIMSPGGVPCEQVGYLTLPPAGPASLRMMGGEFCGNATMSAASYIALTNGAKPGDSLTVPITVSGAQGVLDCAVTVNDGYCTGSVSMPRVTGVTEKGGVTRVDMDGITHFVIRSALPDDEAVSLLRRLSSSVATDAVGLLQWDGTFMKPLVYVRATDTRVWENGCGSGSACLGACLAYLEGVNERVTRVAQPGGVITVHTRAAEYGYQTTITGNVKVGKVRQIKI